MLEGGGPLSCAAQLATLYRQLHLVTATSHTFRRRNLTILCSRSRTTVFLAAFLPMRNPRRLSLMPPRHPAQPISPHHPRAGASCTRRCGGGAGAIESHSQVPATWIHAYPDTRAHSSSAELRPWSLEVPAKLAMRTWVTLHGRNATRQSHGPRAKPAGHPAMPPSGPVIERNQGSETRPGMERGGAWFHCQASTKARAGRKEA